MGGIQKRDAGWTDTERNVIIGQCEPTEDKATGGFMNKWADTVCENMVPSVARSPTGTQWRVGTRSVGLVLLSRGLLLSLISDSALFSSITYISETEICSVFFYSGFS